MKLWCGRRAGKGFSKPKSDRGKAAPAPAPNARLPSVDEQREMAAALDQMVEDEIRLRENGHNPSHPSLYRGDIVTCMDATVAGKPVDPDLMFLCLDMLDALHWMAQVADQGIHRFSTARQALMSLTQVDAS